MLRKLLLSSVLISSAVFGRERIAGWCQQGNQRVVTPGSQNSTTLVQRSYPSCTVTVYLTGTLTLATIYSDNSGTSLGNPFTAQAGNGYWYFYVDNGVVDAKLSAAGIASPFTLGAITANDFLAGFGVLSGGWNGSNYVNEVITNPLGRTFLQAPFALGPLPPMPVNNGQGVVFGVLGYDPGNVMGCTGSGINQCPVLVAGTDAVTIYGHAYNTPSFPRVWGTNIVADKAFANIMDSDVQAAEFTTRNFTSEYGFPNGSGAGLADQSLVGVRSNYGGAAGMSSAAYTSLAACGTSQNCGFARGIWLDGIATKATNNGFAAGGGTFIEFRDDSSSGGGAGIGLDLSKVHGGYAITSLLLPSVDNTSHIASNAVAVVNPNNVIYPALQMNAAGDWLFAGASGGTGHTFVLGAEYGLQFGGGNYPDIASWTGTYTAVTGTTAGSPTLLNIPSHGLATGQEINLIGYTLTWASLNGLRVVTVINANNLSVAVDSTLFGTVTGTPQYLTGGTARFGSGVAQNTDMGGSLTMSGGGTASYTFSGTYFLAPICTSSDTSATPGTPRVQVTNTTLTITGTAAHVYDFICISRR